MSDEKREYHVEVDRLTKEVSVVLRGHNGDVQGSVLAELVAAYLVCHAPDVRDEALALWIKLVDALVPIIEERMLASVGAASWDDLADLWARRQC